MMAVTVCEKKSRQVFTGKFAEVKRGLVTLWSNCQTDRSGDSYGWGRKVGVFPEASVSVSAKDPCKEIRWF